MLQSSVHVRHADVYEEEWYIVSTHNCYGETGNISGNKIFGSSMQ